MKWITALNNSSIAEVGRVYIWDVDYRGKSIMTPTITSFFNIPDMLTQYEPNVMQKPMILDEEPNILECLKIAFDNSVCVFISYLCFTFSKCTMKQMNNIEREKM